MDPNFATPFIFVAHATIRADLCLASPPLPLALAARPPSSPVFALFFLPLQIGWRGGSRKRENQIEGGAAPPCDFYTTTPWWSGNPFGTIATVGVPVGVTQRLERYRSAQVESGTGDGGRTVHTMARELPRVLRTSATRGGAALRTGL